MAASQPMSEHDCCDKSSGHDRESVCQALCALSSSPFQLAAKSEVERQDGSIAAAAAIEEPGRLTASTVRRVEALEPVENAPPLYVVHAAFLI